MGFIACDLIIYVVSTKADWVVFKDPKRGKVAVISLYLVIFFLHFIGLIISFQSFRATVLLNKNNGEAMNAKEDVSTVAPVDGTQE